MTSFSVYDGAMQSPNAYLEIKLDLSKPIEISDFASLFAGFCAEFERYLADESPEHVGTARMYVKEVRKGSVIAALFADIPDMIGLMDEALIVLGFGALFSRRLRDFVRGKHLDGAGKKHLADLTKTVRAVANDPNGSMTIAGFRYKDGILGTEFVAAFSEKDARRALRTIDEQKAILDKVSTSDHERVLMTFQRSDVGRASVGKRTGELVVVSDISEKARALVYGSELAEEQIKDEIRNADDNIFKRGFIVDLNLVFSGPKPVAYSVTHLHQVIDLPEEE